MRKITARAIAQPVNYGSGMEWSLVLWMLAAAFLAATFQVY